MYTPASMEIDEIGARSLVDAVGSGWLVTVGADDAPVGTLLPILWRGDRVVAHLAKANPHWRDLDGARALLIVGGPEVYVSPSWYPSKAEHGRVVPTWNYLAVHLTGTVTVHRDPAWLRAMVTDLTERHEGERADPWAVTDAPAEYLNAMLQAIVGVELAVERVEGKAKLSQNRPEPDQLGVIAGLDDIGSAAATAVADAMRARRVDTA
jgi:transcriptional regulator